MSDDDVEVLFENVPNNRRLYVKKAQKIKSQTTEYLKKRRIQLQTSSKLTFCRRNKTNVSGTQSQLEGLSSSLQFKTIKHHNAFEKQDEFSGEKIVSDVSTNFATLTSPGSSTSTSAKEIGDLSSAERNVSKIRESNSSINDFHQAFLVDQEEVNYLRLVQSSDSLEAAAQDNTFSNAQIFSKTTFNDKFVKEVETNNSKITKGSASPIAKQNIRLSHQLQRNPSKFSINGSPLSSRKNGHLFSNEKKSPKSGPYSPPLTFTRNKITNNAASSERGVKRKLNFGSGSSVLSSSPASSLSEVQNKELSISKLSEINPGYSDHYLYRQFKLHIEKVLHDGKSQYLISKDDKDIINSFHDLNYQCQNLYARMHNRKLKWNRLSDIKYEGATEENVHALEQKGFFSTDLQNVPIENLLELLKLPEIKEVCKSLGIKRPVQKKNCSEEIIRYCQNQRTIIGSAEIFVRKRIKSVLGLSFKLQPEPRNLFRRIHLLFNLKFSRNETIRYGSQDLFDIQFLGTDVVLYPNYEMDQTARIFASRAELLRYHSAEDLKYEYFAAIERKNWNAAEKVLATARNHFIEEFDFVSKLDESDELSSVPALPHPLSLRKFTPGAVYAYILSDGVDVLKRLKKNEEAISDLMLLLDQTTYLPYLRGRWFEKLITIHRMSGNLNEVARTICTAIFDPYIDDQGSYVMSCRIKEILKKKKGVAPDVKSLLRDIPLFPPLESVEPVEIRGCTLDGKTGYKRVYVQKDETGDGKTYTSVEEFVKNYYSPKFFKRGIHAENSLPISLFGILFWDVIYEYYVPCAFIGPFQSRPLDLSSGEFYKNRQSAIDYKLEVMPKWTSDQITSWVKQIYDKNCGKSSLVNWCWFHSSEEILGIINCIGLEIVLKICERYVKKYRSVRGGFPDLFLWTPGQPNEYKFVEVKSHNDKLGVNQKLWLDFLVKIKSNVEVCLVQARGSKTTVSKPENEQSVFMNENDNEDCRSKTAIMIPMDEPENDCMVDD